MKFSPLLLLLCMAELAAAAEKPPLNVLLIIADDLRPDLGCYGHAEVKSPNIDRLAERGLVFERAHCQVALCNPSRASVLTGRRPDATQVLDNGAHIRTALPDAVTLPQWFKQHGYHAQGLGKIFHPGCEDEPSWSAPHWDPQHAENTAASGEALIREMQSYYGNAGRIAIQHQAAQLIVSGKRTLETLKRRDLLTAPWEITHDEELPDEQTAVRAVTVLKEVKDRPFFLAVGFLKPHLPFVAPRKYWDLYPASEVKLKATPPPKDVPAPALYDSSELRAFTGVPRTGAVGDDDARQLIRGYRAATSYTDAQVGRVLDELEHLGLRDRTIVIFLGDHGWQLGEHGIWCKHTNFEVATRAPLIISMPGMKAAGNRTSALVEFVDIYPSLTELAGLPLPADLEGASFAPLLKNPAQPWKRAAFSQYLRAGKEKFTGRSVRTERWRFTEWQDSKGGPAGRELYDETNDPNESVNLANDATQSEVILEMSKLLQEGWRAALPPGIKVD